MTESDPTIPLPTGQGAAGPDEAYDHDELIRFLERDQLVADTSRPAPRAQLGPRINAVLWVLRVFVVVVSLMVVYTFVHQLG